MKAKAPASTTPAAGGDARQASAAIDAWLAEREQGSQQDWEGLLEAIGDRLCQIQAAPAVRDDAVIRSIFADMQHAQSMEQLAADIDRLCDRVAHLLAHPVDAPPGGRRRGRITLRL